MKIEILQGVEGARKARGLAVVIDVFRAFTTACYAYAGGAKSIVPVARAERAYRLKLENPDYLLMGERDTVKLPGFDFGNSPAEIEAADVAGRTIVHTTSAGTQGLAAAEGPADRVLTGAFVNASAVARHVEDREPRVVSLVAMGAAGIAPSDEDTLCAEFIRERLRGGAPNFEEIRNHLLNIDGAAKFFDPEATQAPERDFTLCAALDAFDFVLACDKDAAGLRRLVKLNTGSSD
jgi:2-phosphosulfolactate phosphatase